MSSRARSLLKKLRNKKIEEEGGQPPDKKEEDKTNTTNPLQLPVLTNQSKNSHSVPKEIKKKEEEPFIDPLDYFKTEHIIIKESNMDEYGGANIKKEIEEEKRKEKAGETTTKIGGMIGVRGFKLNFEEMMKARAKVKKEPQKGQKSLSVGTRTKANQNKFEYVKKNKASKEDNLYIKLVLAKNKYNNVHSQHLYPEILKKIDELKGYKDLPENMLKEINDIENDLKLENNLVLCSDVQIVSDDEDDTDSIGKKIQLEQVINKMNIRGDM